MALKVDNKKKPKLYEYKAIEEFQYDNCKCPIQKKILNFATYKDQIFERDAVILLTEDERIHYEAILLGNHEFNALLWKSGQNVVEFSLYLDQKKQEKLEGKNDNVSCL